MDEEFGVGDLVSESFQEEKRHVGASIVCMYACTRCKCCTRVRGASVVCVYEVQVLYVCMRLVVHWFFLCSQAYSSRDLQGLKVEHNLEDFREEKNIILTIKDAGEELGGSCLSPGTSSLSMPLLSHLHTHSHTR